MHEKHKNRLTALYGRLMRMLVVGIALLFLASCSVAPADGTHKAGVTSGSPHTYAYTQDNTLAQPTDAPEDMELVASVDGMALYLDSASTRFALRDQMGTLWYSSLTEENADMDDTAYGEYRRALTSLLSVKTCDANGESAKEYASTRYSVEDGTYTVRYLQDAQVGQAGFRIDFEFVDLSLTIPLVIGLRDGALFAEILTGEMAITDPNTVVLEIGLLPHFGSASREDCGYMLVPDGCGAIIEMNNGRVSSGGFEKQVYGADAAFVKSRKASNEEEALLPVFGMKKGTGAFLAVISGCDAYANVLAEVPGINTDRNYVYPRFRLRELDSFPLKDLSGKAQDYMVVDTQNRALPSMEVQYRFLSGDTADYNGMADIFAEWLEVEKGLKKQEGTPAYVLELYGAVRRKKSVLGVPAIVSEKLTTFEQARTMLDALGQQGVETPYVRYQYATDSRIKTGVSTKPDILSSLGGDKGYNRLAQYIQEQGGQVFLSMNTATAKESLFSSSFIRNVMNLKAYQYSYDSLTGYQDETTKFCLYTPDVVYSKMERLFQNAAKRDSTCTLALETLATQVYSSFGETYFSREDTKSWFADTLALAEEAGIRLMLDGVAAYALPYAAIAVDVPVQSNHYSIVDYDVPFYQLAVSRFLPCVSQPVNLTSNPQMQFLRCLQTGSIPQFAFVAGDPAMLQGTDLERLFAADFEKWLPDVVRMVKEWQTVRDAIGGARMVSFRVLQEGLTETVYENGTAVLVNTGDAACMQDGVEIPAMGYRVLS